MSMIDHNDAKMLIGGGDLVMLDGLVFVIQPDHNNNFKLVPHTD